MNFKLFLSTFILIFLAELGDKTQLALMARAASEDGKWTVFAAGGVALLLSAMLAIIAGAWISRMMPEKYIKLGAAVLFIMFGLALLADAADVIPARRATPRPPHAVGRWIVQAASNFERESSIDYRQMARQTDNKELQDLFRQLAADEDAHLEYLENIGDHELENWPESLPETLSAPDEATHYADSSLVSVLDRAIEHEKATAAFYECLARDTPLPGLRNIFSLLAAEERQHAQRLVSRLEAIRSNAS